MHVRPGSGFAPNWAVCTRTRSFLSTVATTKKISVFVAAPFCRGTLRLTGHWDLMPSECKLRDEFPRMQTTHGRQTSSTHCPKRLTARQQVHLRTTSNRNSSFSLPSEGIRSQWPVSLNVPRQNVAATNTDIFFVVATVDKNDLVRVQTAQFGANPEPGRTCMAPTLLWLVLPLRFGTPSKLTDLALRRARRSPNAQSTEVCMAAEPQR